jgi:lipid II:glycine glycyltransferase (peptidoglycan interpeptide bridge formation enzyme)
MVIKEINIKDKTVFDSLAIHPMQSWSWGEFRKKMGLKLLRLGKFNNDKLIETAQITFHKIPSTKFTIGYFPKGGITNHDILNEIIKYAKKENCIFIKFEPHIQKKTINYLSFYDKFDFKDSPHPLFTKYTFWLNLEKNETDLLKNFHPKTRYNIKIAQKHGIKISFDNSDKAFEQYWLLTDSTTKRQKFFAHTKKYHQTMWETMKNDKIAYLIKADYSQDNKNYTLVSWIVFLFNNVLYYPYGASSNLFRNTMASNLLAYEAIKFGQKYGAKMFDMWGALSPNPDPNDPWFGFHRFKKGYGGELIEFVGSYDLVINKPLYLLYNKLYYLRKILLDIKSNIRNHQ